MESAAALALPEVTALLECGEKEGCVELSQLDQVAQLLSLSDDQIEALEEQIAARGIELEDDCGRAGAAPTGYENRDLAALTTDTLQLFLRDVRRYPLLTADEEVALAKRVERGDLEAKARMVNSNLRLVVSIARRYQGQDVALLDLIQEGVLGLIGAVEKFDWRRGYKFSTYGTFWIRNAMQRVIANSSRTIRIPVHLGQRERKLARAQGRLAVRLGRAPSDEELTAEAEISLAELADLRSFARTVTSLDRPVGEEGETTFGELLPGEQLEPSEELAIDLRRAALRRAVARLPEDERKLIELRYGLTDEQPGPLRELGRRLGRLTEGVRQIEKRGLERLAMERELETLREAA